jgi:hypothetical protein
LRNKKPELMFGFFVWLVATSPREGCLRHEMGDFVARWAPSERNGLLRNEMGSFGAKWVASQRDGHYVRDGSRCDEIGIIEREREGLRFS